MSKSHDAEPGGLHQISSLLELLHLEINNVEIVSLTLTVLLMKLTCRPGGRDCFSFSAFSLSVIFSV